MTTTATAEPGTPVLHRVTVAVLLATLLGAGLLHWALVRSFTRENNARAERAAMIAARAAADVATAHGAEGDALRAAIARWQQEHPTIRAVRVVHLDRRTIEASSFPEDRKDGEMEKPLDDLGQELRANVATNASARTKREKEVRVERRPDGMLLLAAPVEKDGTVAGFAQVLAAPEIVAVSAPSALFALAFALAPFVTILALSFVWRSNTLLVVIAAVLLLVALFAYRQWALDSLVEGAQEAEQRFADRVAREARIVARVAPGAEANAKTWDADEYRQPLRIDPVRAVEGQKDAIANAGYGISVLSLAVLLLIGLGQSTIRFSSAPGGAAP